MSETEEEFWRNVYLACVGRVGPDVAEATANQALDTHKQKFQRIAVPR